jgi:DNA-binding response OmpR family regulator
VTSLIKRILIVDDERDICDLVQTLLCLEGFEVATTSTPKETMQALLDERWDLVLLDVVMPHLDGWEIARFARKRYPELPVVFMTAKVDEERYSNALARGLIQGRLYKPFEIDELHQLMALSA